MLKGPEKRKTRPPDLDSVQLLCVLLKLLEYFLHNPYNQQTSDRVTNAKNNNKTSSAVVNIFVSVS